jgi:hypothetical protein
VTVWDDVRRIALELPETSERESRGLSPWRVKEKAFVWERPLRRADLEALGDDALHEVIVEAWLVRAPKRLARGYMDRTP